MGFKYDFKGKFNQSLEHLIDYSPRIILAILILWIGFLLIKKLMSYYNNKFTSKKISKELKPFLGNALNFSLRLLVIVIAIHVIGVKTSSFAALIAAVGFAIGMALQGSLGNLASGVMILIFKPYKVNDIVNIHKVEGIVEQIDIFNTIVITYDNRKVIIPNGQAINDIITNSTDKEYLRVDMFINLPYTENFERVQEIIKEAFLKTEKVLQNPEPFVGIEDFESHGMKVAIFPYCKPTDYWEVYYSSKASVKKALGENGIKMAYIEGVTFGEIAK